MSYYISATISISSDPCVTADANGVLAGEFFGATEGVQALFGGLQIAGASFPDYVPTGTLLLVR